MGEIGFGFEHQTGWTDRTLNVIKFKKSLNIPERFSILANLWVAPKSNKFILSKQNEFPLPHRTYQVLS